MLVHLKRSFFWRGAFYQVVPGQNVPMDVPDEMFADLPSDAKVLDGGEWKVRSDYKKDEEPELAPPATEGEPVGPPEENKASEEGEGNAEPPAEAKKAPAKKPAAATKEA